MNKSILFASIAVLCWSTVATMFKIALSCYSLLEVLLVASFTSFVVFGIVVLLQNKWMDLFNLGKRDWLFAALVGLLNPVAYYLVLFKAYSVLPAQIAQPVNYSWPIVLVVLLSIVNQRPLSKLKLFGLGISLTGVATISMASGLDEANGLPVMGLLIALLSAFLWAVYWIVNSRNQRMDGIILFLLSFFFGTLYLIVLTLFFPIHVATTQGILSSVYIGLFEMSIPFIFFGMASRQSKNSVLINQLCYLSPFLSLVIIHFVLGEEIRWTTYVGLSLIVLGILFNEYLAAYFYKRHKLVQQRVR
jgi:drug/metabolite transporter (DMT)-like permease